MDYCNTKTQNSVLLKANMARLGYGIIKMVQDISTQYLLLEALLDDIFYTKFVQYIYG